MADDVKAEISIENGQKRIVEIGLNGYKSFCSNPVDVQSQDRLIWSFTILEGDRGYLQQCWSRRTELKLRTEGGQEANVRVVAFPVDSEGYGMIEFI